MPKIHKTKKIRPLSNTRSGGEVISPSAVLRKLKDGRFIVVDDEDSRHHMLTAAIRLGISVTSRKQTHGSGYEIHRIAKPVPITYDYQP